MDNVKFVLNKRWLVARGRQVDVQSLVRNVPGGVTLVTDPKNDIVESNWPDVTSSSYVEHDRLNSEFDDLAGNFSPSTKVANNAVNDTLGGSRMAAQGAGLMTEYLLQTVNTTWWQPVLRQLALLEQHYETDEIILAVCANKAKLFPRFGISRITDMMMMNEVNVSVNMAMGDPNQRLQKFLMATNAAIQLSVNAPPTANIHEMIKEIYSNAGYRDGARFFNEQQDPRLMKAMQAIQQLQGQLQGKQAEMQQESQLKMADIQSNEKVKIAEIQVNAHRIDGDLQLRAAEIEVEKAKLELERLKIVSDAQSSESDRTSRITEAQAKLEEMAQKLQMERERNELEKQAMILKIQDQEFDHQERKTNLALSTLPAVHNVEAMEMAKQTMQHAKGGLESILEQIAQMKDEMDKGKVVGAEAMRDETGRMIGVKVHRSGGQSHEIATV